MPATKTKAKLKQFDLSQISADAIAGYWWEITDGSDKGKFLFNDLLGSIRRGYVDETGEVFRYYYVSSKIIISYEQIMLLPSKMITHVSLANPHTLIFDGTLTPYKEPDKSSVWNGCSEERREKLFNSLVMLEDNLPLATYWLECMIAEDYIFAIRAWSQMSLAVRHKIILDCQENPNNRINSVDKVDKFYQIFLRTFHLFLPKVLPIEVETGMQMEAQKEMLLERLAA
jgi:hypothetical protein